MLKQRQYEEAANGRGVNALMSWLDAVEIPYQRGTKEGVDLVVEASDGRSVPVAVVAGSATLPADEKLIILNAARLTNRDLRISFAEFHVLTTSAGYGEPKPVDRGTPPEKKKLSIEENPVDVLARHREFRTAPNPSEKDFAPYMRVIKATAKHFHNVNRKICLLAGYDEEDCTTYAMLWATSFLHHTKLVDPQQPDANQRMLLKMLRQRFAEFHGRLISLAQAASPDAESVALNEPIDECLDRKLGADDAYRLAHDELGVVGKEVSAAVRRKRAKALLDKYAEQMGPETFTEALEVTAANHPCPVTRAAAQKRLNRVHGDAKGSRK